MRTILINDTDDWLYSHCFAFKDDQDYHAAVDLLRPYEEILEKIKHAEIDEQWDAYREHRDAIWLQIYPKLNDLAALHLQGVTEYYNEFDYKIDV